MHVVFRFSDLKVGHKLFVVFGLGFCLILLIAFFAVYEYQKREQQLAIEDQLAQSAQGLADIVGASVDTSIHNHLRAIAEKSVEIVDYHYVKATKGNIPYQTWRKEVKDELSALSVGKTGYVYVLDCSKAPQSITVAIHPQIEGREVASWDFVQESYRVKTGYFEYNWQNPGDSHPRPKAQYVAYYKPLNWLIAVSSYREEFASLITVDDFKLYLKNHKFGERGYSFILRDDGEVVYHPYLAGNLLFGDSRIATIARQMVEKKNGSIYYDWTDPNTPRACKKIMIVRYLPELGWIVGSSGYWDEFFHPLGQLRRTIWLAGVISLLIMLLVTYWLGRTFSKPLIHLGNKLQQCTLDDFEQRVEVKSNDEIGKLGAFFNEFMDRLAGTALELKQEVEKHRNTEEALQIGNRRLQLIMDSAIEGFWETSPLGITLSVNPETCRMLGLPEEAILGRPISEFTTAEGRHILQGQLDNRQHGINGSYELDLVKSDNTIVHCLVNSVPLLDENGNHTSNYAMFSNITRRKQAELEIQETKEYLFEVFNSVSSVLFTLDAHGLVLHWNTKATLYTGFGHREAHGKHYTQVLPLLLNYRARIDEMLKRHLPFTIQNIMDDQTPIHYLNLNLYPMQFRSQPGMVVRLEDITELVRKDEQLRQTQKMELIGTLASGLAHDFNNVVGAITAAVSIIEFGFKEDKPNGDDTRQMLEIIKVSARQASGIVKKMLMLARRHPISRSPFDLNLIMNNVRDICKNTFDKCVSQRFVLPNEPMLVMGDQAQMEQVILNICVNGYHAMTIMRPEGMEQGGELSVEVRAFNADERFMLIHPESRPGDYWRLIIADTGVGMNEATKERIFEPFFTTKPQDKGTGLGLSMVYNTITQHGGAIDVYSQPGHGTSFSIYLPVLEASDGLENPPEVEKQIVYGSGTVLVVDDENSMREVAVSILHECGYKTLTATNGYEGLEVYNQNLAVVDAVLLDLAMPGLSGLEVYKRLRVIRPGIQVLMSSGYRQDTRIDEVLLLGVKDFIQKPYTLTELSQKIATLFEPFKPKN